jgi:hypothetical protein
MTRLYRHSEEFIRKWSAKIERLACRYYRQFMYFLCWWLLWRGKPRPSRMYRRGRPVDPDFQPSEGLFFRCQQESIQEDRRIKPASVRFPDQSVNREKFSRCTDVLMPSASRDEQENSQEWILWGVAKILVSDIPAPMETVGGRPNQAMTYSFTVAHDPEEDNYGHSELRVFKNGQRESDKRRISDNVKKRYRTMIALKAGLVVRPLI